MKTITLPNGNTLTWDGSLDEKIRLMELMGIPFTPSQNEITADNRKKNSRSKLALANGYATMETNEILADIEAIPGNSKEKEKIKRLAVLVCALLDEVMPDRGDGA